MSYLGLSDTGIQNNQLGTIFINHIMLSNNGIFQIDQIIQNINK